MDHRHGWYQHHEARRLSQAAAAAAAAWSRSPPGAFSNSTPPEHLSNTAATVSKKKRRVEHAVGGGGGGYHGGGGGRAAPAALGAAGSKTTTATSPKDLVVSCLEAVTLGVATEVYSAVAGRGELMGEAEAMIAARLGSAMVIAWVAARRGLPTQPMDARAVLDFVTGESRDCLGRWRLGEVAGLLGCTHAGLADSASSGASAVAGPTSAPNGVRGHSTVSQLCDMLCISNDIAEDLLRQHGTVDGCIGAFFDGTAQSVAAGATVASAILTSPPLSEWPDSYDASFAGLPPAEGVRRDTKVAAAAGSPAAAAAAPVVAQTPHPLTTIEGLPVFILETERFLKAKDALPTQQRMRQNINCADQVVTVSFKQSVEYVTRVTIRGATGKAHAEDMARDMVCNKDIDYVDSSWDDDVKFTRYEMEQDTQIHANEAYTRPEPYTVRDSEASGSALPF
jgi:hypothetical protein